MASRRWEQNYIRDYNLDQDVLENYLKNRYREVADRIEVVVCDPARPLQERIDRVLRSNACKKHAQSMYYVDLPEMLDQVSRFIKGRVCLALCAGAQGTLSCLTWLTWGC